MSATNIGETNGQESVLADSVHYAAETVAGQSSVMKETSRPVRRLEESGVLPGEASFATVKLADGCSPGNEFLRKRRRGKVAFGIVVVILGGGVITFALLKKPTAQRTNQIMPATPIVESSSTPARSVVPEVPPQSISDVEDTGAIVNQSVVPNSTPAPAEERGASLRPKPQTSSAARATSVSENRSTSVSDSTVTAVENHGASNTGSDRPGNSPSAIKSPNSPPPASSPTSPGTSPKPKVIPWP